MPNEEREINEAYRIVPLVDSLHRAWIPGGRGWIQMRDDGVSYSFGLWMDRDGTIYDREGGERLITVPA